MSISFEDDMNPETEELLEKLFDVQAMDKRHALLAEKERQFNQMTMKKIANTAGQPVSLEINKIGDRKEVGGLVYELTEAGWKRLPIGTKL